MDGNQRLRPGAGGPQPAPTVSLARDSWPSTFGPCQSGGRPSVVLLAGVLALAGAEPATDHSGSPAASSQQPAGPPVASQAGLALSRKGVMVTAFGEDPDGNSGTLLRLWEQGGVSSPLTVTLPAGLKAVRAQPINLRGEKAGQPIPITDGKLTFTLPAYAPASFILQ